MLDLFKMVEKQSEAFYTFLWHFFPSLEQNFISYRSTKVSSRPDFILEIHQLWQWGSSRVYSNCWCSCSFESEVIKIGQSSHNMYSNDILNFQESMTILNACTKRVWKLIEGTAYIYSWVYIERGLNISVYMYLNKGDVNIESACLITVSYTPIWLSN